MDKFGKNLKNRKLKESIERAQKIMNGENVPLVPKETKKKVFYYKIIKMNKAQPIDDNHHIEEVKKPKISEFF